MMQTNRERWFSLAGFLMVVVLPLLGPVWMVDQFMADREVRATLEADSQLEQDYFRFLYANNPREVFCQQFARVYSWIRKRDFSEAATKAMPRFFSPALKCEIAVFTPEGKMVTPPWGRMTARFTVTKLWSEFQSRIYDPKKTRLYRSLFGPGFFPWDARDRPGYPFLVENEKGEGVLLWQPGRGQGGLLAYVTPFPSSFSLMRKTLGKMTGEGIWGVYHPRFRRFFTQGTLAKPAIGPALFSWERVIRQARLEGQETFIHEGYLCRVFPQREGFWVLRATSLEAIDNHRFRCSLWILSGLVLIATFYYWFKPGMSPVARLALSARLPLIFFLAILFPLAFLLNLGSTLFSLQKVNLEEQVQERAVTRLRNLDFAYKNHLERLLNLCRHIRDSDFFRGSDGKRITKAGFSLRDKMIMGKLETRDITGEEIAKVEGTDKYTSSMVSLFCKEVIRRYLHHPLPRIDSKTEHMISKFLFSRRLNFTTAFDHPDTLVFLASGKGNSAFWYWDAVKPTARLPMAYINFIQYSFNVVQNFLARPFPLGIYVFNNERRQWAPRPPNSVQARALVFQALMSRKAVRQVVRSGARSILLTAFPCSAQKGFAYVTVSNLGAIRNHLSRNMGELVGLAFLTIFMTLLFSRLLSTSFLEPIALIAKGIGAIERREFEFRLPPMGGDEFGELGKTLNTTIEGMHELDFGRTVQMNLIPKAAPKIPGYDVAIFTESATDLGGDYLDAFMDARGRGVFITGDVAGHGVSSALLMTMAKVVCHLSSREGSAMPQYLTRLNNLIHDVVKKKKFMSLVMAMLDANTHELDWASVGHPYPLLRTNDGKTRFLEMSQLPLGIMPKTKWKVAKLTLEPGETLLFYTDGIIEARNLAGKEVGFDRFAGQLAGCGDASAEQIIQTLLRDYRAHIQGLPADDDITLLTIQRQTG